MNQEEQLPGLFWVLLIVLAILLARRRWRPSQTAFGTACWASEQVLKAAGMLGDFGLVLGRTTSGKLIRLRDYCHVLLVGATGSGKGVSVIIPQLLSYRRGSLVVFDTKGDLLATAGRRRAALGQRVIRLAPFAGGRDGFNPLDLISGDSPMLVDSARALAEALVVRTGMENDPHWNDKASQVICALLVLVLLRFDGKERSLNTVSEIASDPELLAKAADHLCDMGGIPARLGHQLKGLFDLEGRPTKEGSGVLSTVARHLAFLDSELVGQAVARTTFDVGELLSGKGSLFIQIPPSQLEAAKGLLRVWLTTLIRVIGEAGDERAGEVLCLLDEASALEGLSSVEEALVRGRSAGVRMVLAYQSDAQVQAAFKGKPTLIYDNCTTQIYLGASSIETAERLSKSIGEWTQVVESYGENSSRSWQEAGTQGGQFSRGRNFNYAVQGRALIRPEEILTLPDEYLIALHRGTAPILARRIKWYQDPDFWPLAGGRPAGDLFRWLLLAAAALVALAFLRTIFG